MPFKDKQPVVDMRWLVEGRDDDFAHYLNRPREDLPAADLSDDELANYAFMNYDRDMNAELAVMMGHIEGLPKIAIMTAVKERLRWLSRRLAVAEGRYPGMPSHGVSEMPELAMAGDEGRILTVNPDWCDWYESTYGTDTGSGFIKGKAIINQVLFAYQTVEDHHELTSEAMREALKSAVHKMLETDPSRGLPEFKTIKEAEESVTGQRDRYYDQVDGTYYVEGYLNTKELEALLFAARVRELVAKLPDAPIPNIELVQVNQLRQVILPGRGMTDVDSNIFSAPVGGMVAEAGTYLNTAKPLVPLDHLIARDITGEPLSRFILTDAPGGNVSQKNLTVLRDLDTDQLLEIAKWRQNGTPFGPELDAQLRGFTDRDLSAVLVERMETMRDEQAQRGTGGSILGNLAANLKGVDLFSGSESRSAEKSLLPGGLKASPYGEMQRWKKLDGAKELSTAEGWTKHFGVRLVKDLKAMELAPGDTVIPPGFDLNPPILPEGRFYLSTLIVSDTDRTKIYHRSVDTQGQGFVHTCTKRGNYLGAERFPEGDLEMTTEELVLPLLYTDEQIPPACVGLVHHLTRTSQWQAVMVVANEADKAGAIEHFQNAGGNLDNLVVMVKPDSDYFGRAMRFMVPMPKDPAVREFFGFTLKKGIVSLD
jgi:hypothetical protein